ncbi:MAG TPA: class I adenylate-forming enzyme family protein [Myxococcota bacterium]|nr:class I adenylate-forming enzyme family protein [Myxococcota bacterium]
MSGSALIDALRAHASARPDALAVRETSARDDRRSLTWSQLAAAAASFASGLPRGGAQPLLVSAPNGLEPLVALLGGLWRGADVVVLPPDLPAAPLRELARRSGAKVAVAGDGALAPLAAEGLEARPLASVALDSAAGAAPEPEAARGLTEPDAARGSLVLLTSGTTGIPRLVRRRAPALDAVGCHSAAAIGLGADDAMLLAIPLCHSFGIDQGLLTAVTAGCRIELHPGFALPRVRAALRDDGITTLPAVPYLFDLLARSVPAGERPAPALRRAISAGSMLPHAVFEEFGARFGLALGQVYGATEFGSVTYSDPRAPDFRARGVGRPLAQVEIRILDAEAPQPSRPLAPGVAGVVAVRAASMFERYLGEPAPALPDGFFLTGDIGELDREGRLALTGRLALLIDVGGRKVNPLEVESVLEAHPAVQAAAVVPARYSRTVSRLKAIIVPDGASAPDGNALRSYLREQLDDYKIPRRFEFRESLPRSSTGKLLRQQLAADDAARGAESS